MVEFNPDKALFVDRMPDAEIVLRGDGLSIADVVRVARFGARVKLTDDEAADLQENLIWFMKSDAGKFLPLEDVRAAMVIRANTHLLGFSGLRLELVRRMVMFLNAGLTLHVREYGSIGASAGNEPFGFSRITAK